MNRLCSFWAILLLLMLAGPAWPQSTTLSVGVYTPSPPISSADVVGLYARTPTEVFPDSGHGVTSTFTVTGFDIDWDISSVDASGIALPVLEPLGIIDNVQPLAPGTYRVTANWQHTGSGLLVGAPSSGIGTTIFVVIPEPSTIVLLAIGVALGGLPVWRASPRFHRVPTPRL